MQIKTLRKWHKRLSLYFGIIIFFYALSGIILNHRQLLANFFIDRNYLPSNFHLHHWNQASIKGKIDLNEHDRLIFGNIGVYKTTKQYQSFVNFNQGLPTGIDFKKSFDLTRTSPGQLFLATESGLFYRDKKQWIRVHHRELPRKRIYTVKQIDNKLFFMTRNHLYSFPLLPFYKNHSVQLTTHKIIPPKNFKNKMSLFRTFWFIHSGEIFGFLGKLFVDFLSILLILFVATGFFFVIYKFIKKRRLFSLNATKTKITLRSIHLKFGSYLAIFLLISAITGTFLRPPFLILINDITVSKIPGTHFYNDNPWFEKLRGFYYDQAHKDFYIFTGRGDIYYTTNLNQPVKKLKDIPPISIMGLNYFDRLDKNYFLVGSFSGLYAWNPSSVAIYNYFTRRRYIPPTHPAPPVSDHLISGIIQEKNSFYIFDYSSGAHHFSKMPEKIKKAYPMSLWNLALEMHTGRLFSQYLGPLFLLYVPFSGIALAVILVFGLLLWLKAYRRKTQS
jgi:hypothetical protein